MEIFKMARDIPQGRPIRVFIVEQNAKKALGIADRAAGLELGKLVLEGSADQVRSNPRVRETYRGANVTVALPVNARWLERRPVLT
jgi:branched-chain amino acid transport system ATP-binding protein